MMYRLSLAAWALLACGATQAQTCYELLAPGGQVVSRATASPVDLSMPIGQALQARGLVGHQLVYYPDDGTCEPPDQPAAQAQPDQGDGGRLQAILDGIEARHGPASYLASGASYDEPGWRWGRHGLREEGQRAYTRGGWQPVYTGPRGGRFVVTAAGNKRYLRGNDPRR